MTQLPAIIGVLVALAYFPRSANAASWPRSIIKTIPLLLFSCAAYVGDASAFLIAGLFLSALGDFGLSRDGDAAFLYGLSAFALAHVLYILHFLGLSDASIYDAFSTAPAFAIALVALVISTEVWLAPHTGNLRLPVRFYVLIIGLMGLSAMAQPFGLSVVGAGLFILSDLILAIQLFRMHEAHPRHTQAGYAVWLFYIAGQFLILSGG